jgi:hypothetical protein
MKASYRLLIACIALGAAAVAGAQVKLGPVELHGYGDVTAVHADSDAAHGWEVRHDVSLVAHLPLSERVEFWAQGAHLGEGVGLKLDWAFFNWQLTPATTLRIGQIKLPFGLINETRDVQALRPSVSLPQLYTDDLSIIDEAFRGVAVEQRIAGASGSETTLELFAARQIIPDADDARTGYVFGSRISWKPAASSWMYRVSAYAGHVDPLEYLPVADRQDKYAFALAAERSWDAWQLQVEVARATVDVVDKTPAYLQLRRRWSDRWASFIRLESTQLIFEGETGRWDRAGAGLAWMPTHHLGARMEVSRNKRGQHSEILHQNESWFEASFALNFVF